MTRRRTKFSTEEDHENRRAEKNAAKAKKKVEEPTSNERTGTTKESEGSIGAKKAEGQRYRSVKEPAQRGGEHSNEQVPAQNGDEEGKAKARKREEGPGGSKGSGKRGRSRSRGSRSEKSKAGDEEPAHEDESNDRSGDKLNEKTAGSGKRGRSRSRGKKHERTSASESEKAQRMESEPKVTMTISGNAGNVGRNGSECAQIMRNE